MRHFDLSPLYRQTIGFDRLFNILDQVSGADVSQTYPPYNIERRDENHYRITLAVAGFAEDDLTIETKESVLTVRGSKENRTEGAQATTQILYQGIAGRQFERRYQLADHVQVEGAHLEHGLFHIDLVREIPEAQKPRQIPINSAVSDGRKVDHIRAA
jgi:molecular chaperone IbpA